MSTIPELDAGAITQLIDKIVDDITDAEIDALIAFFRKERETVLLAEAQGTKAKRSNLNKAAVKVELENISTTDLELD